MHVRFDLPARFVRRTPLESLNATFSVTNLATWTSFHGSDPAVSNGGSVRYAGYAGYYVNADARYYGSSAVPTPRTYSLRFSSEF